jgi:hypothetical protein
MRTTGWMSQDASVDLPVIHNAYSMAAGRVRRDVGRWTKTAWLLGNCESHNPTGFWRAWVKVESWCVFVEVWNSGVKYLRVVVG